MTKKTTLRHIVNGQEFTRTTSREYTHVVVVRNSREKALAAIRPVDLEKVTEKAGYDFDHYSGYIATPVGECYYYHRGQGGAYRNSQGKFNKVRQALKDTYIKFIDGMNREEYIQNAITEANERHQSELKSIEEMDCETWRVAAWSSRRDLAEKAADQFAMFETRVEEING